ncbi:MAG TPA: GNAT family N-acetyltransferase [Cryptosporangiaceae bacterium]|nr:GNAT family N-acetyltransferase [Cryptosporangiaceae bacterium]
MINAATLRISHHDAEGARAIEDELFAVYAEVYADRLDNPFFSVERFAERFRAHSSRPGYALVAGYVAGKLVGYAYGVPLAAHTRWWEGLREPVEPGLTDETGRRTFGLNEIMVLAEWRRRGIARRLHDELLAARPEERATLLVEPTNVAARSAYQAWGWRLIGHIRPFPDAPVYDAMLLDLRSVKLLGADGS